MISPKNIVLFYFLLGAAPPQTASRTILGGENRIALETPSVETLRALLPKAQPRRQARARLNLWERRSNAAGFLNPIVADRFVPDRGQAMVAAIAALPEERRMYGVAGLTEDQIFNQGLCETAEIDVHVQHEGETYEIRYAEESFTWATTPVADLYALSSTCTAALLSSGGMISRAIGAGCAPEDEAAHFEAGSACRACLATDGDHARCVGAGQCQEQMARELGIRFGGQTTYYDVLVAELLACAPSLMMPMFYLVEELGENNTPPPAFDNRRYRQFCWWMWNQALRAPSPQCYALSGEIHPTAADVITGRVVYIRKAGETSTPYADRWLMASSVEVEGHYFDTTALPANSVSMISEPDRYIGGWGYHPQQARPDATNPDDPHQTYARDWIAALCLKTATRINGVLINTYNRNQCSPEMWKGPDARGRYFCKPPFFGGDFQPPDEPRWSYDWGGYVRSNPPLVETYPMVTLASTGLPDPNIPGGHVPKIYGSPTLADPDWDGCEWPDIFYPDEIANYDSVLPHMFTFTSQTYRFGKDPQADIRLVLATNRRRDFCFPTE